MTAPQEHIEGDGVDDETTTLDRSEETDEDQLRQDPLEGAMDPPEHWTGATSYGMTPREESQPRPLDERLAEEEPDVVPGSAPQAPGSAPADIDTEGVPTPPAPGYEEDLGISADVAGGSMPSEIRHPEPPD
ncbi:hypothetical protein NN3_20270 [Nocardia neocaledoniensis NBRC 108232]|uniref:DUF5709 domain-containing protein n=1 Tax=Nocardia neocaledoniensis TaxID=236511 RepID=A0A317N1E0_9NOCA|nr:hypothetical protein [Nocardia neocaledoniensis]PWV67760.1 hypothetical protein DFR69_11974 [Nocardia neocaledoniensis]GEM31020.1 hypothetical protein NN3_20270 [Nocardia neocaledoniensis NBRC 108232]